MTTTSDDHIERLQAMLDDDGGTWDLSPNDKAAIRGVLAERDALRSEVDRLTAVVASREGDARNARDYAGRLEAEAVARDAALRSVEADAARLKAERDEAIRTITALSRLIQAFLDRVHYHQVAYLSDAATIALGDAMRGVRRRFGIDDACPDTEGTEGTEDTEDTTP